MRLLLLCFMALCCGGCAIAQQDAPYVLVLGIAQDGGYPHMGCRRECCNKAWADAALRRYVVSLAVVDPAGKKWWLIEATPDIKEQLQYFSTLTNGAYNYLPEGIFITHAHIGHYTGLMQLGREVMSTSQLPVYVLPRLAAYLRDNGPWSQLVSLQNIALHTLAADSAVQLPGGISITAFTVPHRDEYSETAGFKITTTAKKYLFIPDINKWDKWSRSIVDETAKADIALLDATCYDDGELPSRNMKVIQHPNVIETMALFAGSSNAVKSHIYFIHINHTNPLLWDNSQRQKVVHAGYHVARQGEKL